MLDPDETKTLIIKLHVMESNRPGPNTGKRWYTVEVGLARRLLTAYLRHYAPEYEKFLDREYFEAEGYELIKSGRV